MATATIGNPTSRTIQVVLPDFALSEAERQTLARYGGHDGERAVRESYQPTRWRLSPGEVLVTSDPEEIAAIEDQRGALVAAGLVVSP